MNKLSELRNIATALICCLIAVSCSEEDTGTVLPTGMYPLTFTSSIKSSIPATRVSENQEEESIWNGNETVKVEIDKEIRDYNMDDNGNLSSSHSFYWNSTDETKWVTAWYPADLTFNDQLKDQSTGEKYINCDVLKTDLSSVTYTGEHELLFKHQMAKVVINILQSDETAVVTEVGILCPDDFTYSNGQLTVASDAADYVMPFKQEDKGSYKAMIIPKNMESKQFIKVVYNGDTYYWTAQNGKANLAAGNVYVYNITMMSSYMDVEAVQMTSNDISWEEQENSTESGTVN